MRFVVRSRLVLRLLRVSGGLMCDQAVRESVLRFNSIITKATRLGCLGRGWQSRCSVVSIGCVHRVILCGLLC